jgi:DNA-binding MarR family transcriptional regulator
VSGARPYAGRVAKIDPLTPAEEQFWRALMHIVVALPRHLHSDMVRTTGLTANEYTTLMCLSEAPKRELRMAALAGSAGLSASRMTRLVDDLQTRGFVAKRVSADDGRGNIVRLSPAGLAKLRSAWPDHLASARARVLDHVDPASLKRAGDALSAVAAQLDERPRTAGGDGRRSGPARRSSAR